MSGKFLARTVLGAVLGDCETSQTHQVINDVIVALLYCILLQNDIECSG